METIEQVQIIDNKLEFLKKNLKNLGSLLLKDDLIEIANQIKEFKNTNYENKALFKDKIQTILQKEIYNRLYKHELPLEKKQEITLYVLLSRDERKEYLNLNIALVFYLKIIIFEKYSFKLLNSIENINDESKFVIIDEENLVPKKKEKDEIYKLIEDNPEKFKIPQRFIDPISKTIMEDPVFCAYGYTYDRESITNWLKTADTTPVSGQKLFVKSLTPNLNLKSDLKEYLEKLKSSLKNISSNKKRKLENDDENNQNKKIKV